LIVLLRLLSGTLYYSVLLITYSTMYMSNKHEHSQRVLYALSSAVLVTASVTLQGAAVAVYASSSVYAQYASCASQCTVYAFIVM
jgi:hypothetical protein